MTTPAADDHKSLHRQAEDEAYMWALAVQAQAERVLDGAGTGADATRRKMDVYLLIIALRNVYRAGELALVDAPKGSARLSHVRGALESFEQAVPGFKDARDALEHFDDYRQGKGGAQQPGVKWWKRQRRDDLARSFLTYYMWNGTDYQVTIGTATISVNDASEAAITLLYDLDAAGRL